MSQFRSPITLREAFVQASSFLSVQSLDSKAEQSQPADRVALLLLEHLSGLSRSELYLNWDNPFPEAWLEEWNTALQRKTAGEPIQYIIGEQEFYGHQFHVNPAVLIPRPETELLVEAILTRAGQRSSEFAVPPVAADIGTGSGAIATTLALQQPSWQIWAVDISEQALQVAAHNAERLGTAPQMKFVHGDLLMPLLERKISLDIVVSNPPYIPSADLAELQREVKDFEPMRALDGGADGLDLYRRLLEQIDQLPRRPKLLGLETGIGQAEQVVQMVANLGGWSSVETIPDLAGIERHVIASS